MVRGSEEDVAVTGVQLNKRTLTLAPTETETLVATISPEDAANKSLRWSSSDSDVATVDANGKVTAAAEGTAVITVSTVDGGYTAQCTVTVSEDTPEVVAVENVKLDRSSLTLDVGETEQLTATVTPKMQRTRACAGEATMKTSFLSMQMASSPPLTAALRR